MENQSTSTLGLAFQGVVTSAITYPFVRLLTQIHADNVLSESTSKLGQIHSSIKSTPGKYISGIKPYLGYFGTIIAVENLFGSTGSLLAAIGLYPLRLISTFNALNVGEYSARNFLSSYSDKKLWRGSALYLFSLSTMISPLFFLLVGLPVENLRYTYVVGQDLGKVNNLSEAFGYLKNKGVTSFYRGLPLWTLFTIVMTGSKFDNGSKNNFILGLDNVKEASH